MLLADDTDIIREAIRRILEADWLVTRQAVGLFLCPAFVTFDPDGRAVVLELSKNTKANQVRIALPPGNRLSSFLFQRPGDGPRNCQQ